MHIKIGSGSTEYSSCYNHLLPWVHVAAGPLVRVKDSTIKALHTGQCCKYGMQPSHTHVCLQGSSTLLTAAFWHTTQSLSLASDQPSSPSSSLSSKLVSLDRVSVSSGWDAPGASAPSADIKRGCRRKKKRALILDVKPKIKILYIYARFYFEVLFWGIYFANLYASFCQ